MRMTILFVPWTLYMPGLAAPAHTTLAVAQLKAPAREMATIAADHVPGFSAIVPRSKSWSRLNDSGLLTLALTSTTFVAAMAGLEGIDEPSARSIAAHPTRTVISAPCPAPRKLQEHLAHNG